MTQADGTSNVPQHLLELFDSVQDVIYVRDLDGNILDINAAGLRILGKAKSEVVGHPFPEGIGQITSLIAKTNQVLLDQGQAKTRVEIVDARGEQRILEATTTLFRDESGQPRGVYGVMRDMTDSIDAQESLRLANEKLVTLMAILKDEKERTEQALVDAKATREEAERLREVAEQAIEFVKEDHERKSAELDDARRLLLSLLPQSPPQRPDYEIAVYMKTASEVGGDYYDFVSEDGAALITAVGDATGHGPRAGMLSAAAKSYFQELASELSPGALLERMNRAFFVMNLQTLYLAFAVVRIENGKAIVASAGMPPILVKQASTSYVRAISAHGIPLGIYGDSTYDEATIDLNPGDTVLIMSDGLADAMNPEEQEFGYEQILAAFASANHASVDHLLLSFDSAVKEWCGVDEFEDDITMVALRRKA